jgi:hypothetical protein
MQLLAEKYIVIRDWKVMHFFSVQFLDMSISQMDAKHRCIHVISLYQTLENILTPYLNMLCYDFQVLVIYQY